MPTVHDIARHAGVAVGTVSRVLRHHPAVREEMRRRVWRAVEELEYRPLRRRAGRQLLQHIGVVTLGMDRSLATYRRRAHRYFTAGADGLSRWDTDGWLAHVGLSHPASQRLWVEKYLPPEDNTLISTAGLNRIYYSPGHGV